MPFVQQSAWHVPLRWFVLFRPEERSIADDERGRLRLRYRTPARRAMRRAENAIPILRRSDLGQLGELLVDLHQWIAAFDPRSIVELDYGELSDLMSWDEMDDDHSAGHDPARARRARRSTSRTSRPRPTSRCWCAGRSSAAASCSTDAAASSNASHARR